MTLSPVLHFMSAVTMKAFLVLVFLAALSLAVSSLRLIRFSFMYHKGLQEYFSIHLSESPFVFILFYASIATDHKSHKAIYHTELSVHIHFCSNISFCFLVLVMELWFIGSNFYITYKYLLGIFVIFFSTSKQMITFLVL